MVLQKGANEQQFPSSCVKKAILLLIYIFHNKENKRHNISYRDYTFYNFKINRGALRAQVT